MRIFRKISRSNTGATAIEYVLVAAIFAIVCITAFTYMAGENSELFDRVGSSVSSANSAGL